MAIAGKKLLVKVSTASGGTYTTVGQMASASLNIAGNNFDVTAFGSSWITRLQGIKDTSWSLSGFLMTTDTNGQSAVRNALVNDTALHAQFLVDGTTGNGFQQEVKVSAFDVSASVDGPVELSISFEGTDAVTVYTT